MGGAWERGAGGKEEAAPTEADSTPPRLQPARPRRSSPAHRPRPAQRVQYSRADRRELSNCLALAIGSFVGLEGWMLMTAQAGPN
jgi:hypothetical protein